MDFRGLRNHIRLVSGRLCGRFREGGSKQGTQMEAKKTGGKGEEKGKSHTERRERKGRDSETFEEMVGGKQVQKSNRHRKSCKALTWQNHILTGGDLQCKYDPLLFALLLFIEDKRCAYVSERVQDYLCAANNIISYFGFSSGSGSFRPSPTGLFSASSAVTRWSSASTLPCNDK